MILYWWYLWCYHAKTIPTVTTITGGNMDFDIFNDFSENEGVGIWELLWEKSFSYWTDRFWDIWLMQNCHLQTELTLTHLKSRHFIWVFYYGKVIFGLSLVIFIIWEFWMYGKIITNLVIKKKKKKRTVICIQHRCCGVSRPMFVKIGLLL